MAHAEREVVDLLKESIESKINAKTTWNSTLIDEFSNVEKFKEKETNNMNFQHASIVLDGCMKVYSTRVDSVVDEADKLMDSVGRAKEPEKQRARAKAHPTIESNPDAILIKPRIESLDDEILEHLAREFKEGDTRGLLMHLLKWSDGEGFCVMRLPGEKSKQEAGSKIESTAASTLQTHTLDFNALRQSLYLGESRKHISPMFSTFTPDKSVEELVLPTYAYHISYDVDPLEYGYKEGGNAFAGYLPYMEGASGEESGGYASADPEEGEEVCAKEKEVEQFRPSREELHLVYTPFGYAKGWAGPAHWKVHSRRKHREKEKADVKERKKAAIDFLTDTHLPISTLFEKGEGIVMTPQQISERRKNCNTLPPDHNIGIEDLYRMFVYPGSLYATEKLLGAPEKEINMPSSSPSLYEVPETAYAEQEDAEFTHTDAPAGIASYTEDAPVHTQEEGFSGATTLLSRRLLQSALRKARRNDIVKIKENMWSRIEQGEKKVEEMYSTMQEQKVSVQFYLVSLLHLANEKNLRINSLTAEPLPGISDLALDTSLV
ncbi:hypothetical protein NERG_01879 [Nematocida ausubeli]|uniref:Condensin complex subunit 2 n=1 Tax=Nematocida ausubeli (strain ATCC PRA-371 / ERTm2) TaxID=1913371 RepID=H8ZE58_NEMA1|nr:hypothetical protein NERG_01879 [Nematocida ausubeli]